MRQSGAIIAHLGSILAPCWTIMALLGSNLTHCLDHLGSPKPHRLVLAPQTIPRSAQSLPEPKSRKSGLVAWRHCFASALNEIPLFASFTSEIHLGKIAILHEWNPSCDVANYSFNVVLSCSMMVNSMGFLAYFAKKTAYRAGRIQVQGTLKIGVFSH